MTTLLAFLVELDSLIGPTFMVVVSALASEFCGRLSVPPVDILHGLASRLSSYSRETRSSSELCLRLTAITAAVQEACLLSMLRIVADLDEPPSDVISTVQKLGEFAGRHIRRVSIVASPRNIMLTFSQRCDQFVTLCGQKQTLAEIVTRAQSPAVSTSRH